MNKKLKITPLDVGVSLALLALAVYVVYRLTMQLNYKWNWGILPQYFFYFDDETGRWVSNILIKGLLTTIRLSVWATLLAFFFGAVTGLMRISKRLFWRLIGTSYVELIRNMPPLVLVFIFYFFVSDQIMPLLGVEDFVRSRPEGVKAVLTFLFASPPQFTAFISGTITVAVFQGAYITEIVRAGIQSIEKGQWEASYALGLTWGQQMRWVILPQAVKRVLPPLTNEFINTIKYSAIVSVISIQELTFQGMQIMASTYVTIEVWITITAIYLIICFSLSMGVRKLEAHLARSEG
jgi:polar amino acid transport system permease protein